MKKYAKQTMNVLIIITFVVFIIIISPKTMQNDTFWSIKVGERIVKEGIFGLDNFSIHHGLDYVAHHYLTDIIIYLIYIFCGFLGLYFFEVILSLALAGILYLLNREISNSKTISLVMLFCQLVILSNYISVRAQMISFILFGLELLLLEKYMKYNKKSYLIVLGIIPILLANFHMGVVPFYFIILGVYIVSLVKIRIPLLTSAEKTDKVRIKQLIIVTILCLIGIFINPYFIDGVIYPFKTLGNDFINSNIIEFQPYSMSLDGGRSLVFIIVVILILLFARQKIYIRDFLLIFGTLFMSFVAVRYISLFVICSAVTLRRVDSLYKTLNLKVEDIKTLKATGLVMFIIITVLNTRIYLKEQTQYVSDKKYPVKAVEFLKQEITEDDKIFNYYDWGSYLMLNDMKVYIDSRCDLYTKEYSGVEIAQDYSKLCNCDKNYKDIIYKYNINMIIIPVDLPLVTLLEENIEFENVYKDELAVVYKKK